MSGENAYHGIVAAIERLHRHFLDVLRAELHRRGIEDVNAVQALLLFNIGESEVVIRDLRDRGYYHGSNVSYNIKKLTELGYLDQERCAHDRRSVRLRLTDRGLTLCLAVRDLQAYLAERLAGVAEDDLRATERTMQSLDRTWTEFLRYGREN